MGAGRAMERDRDFITRENLLKAKILTGRKKSKSTGYSLQAQSEIIHRRRDKVISIVNVRVILGG